MVSLDLSPIQRGSPDRPWWRDLFWSSVEFKSFDPTPAEKEPPSFLKEGKEFPGDEVKVVIRGRFGLLIKDEQKNGFIVMPTEEPSWVVRPRIDKLAEVVIGQERFLERDSDYKGLIVGGCMRGGKSTLLKELGIKAAESRKKVLFIRPKRARKVDRHQELPARYPGWINLYDIESVDEVLEVVDSYPSDLVVLDEMNLLIFAPSLVLNSQREKAEAIASTIEAIIKRRRKFAGALLTRFATGEAFPPINELLALQRVHQGIEFFSMYAQCLCGAVAEVQALTELWWWQGEFSNGGKCLVRPLVPIDEEREAIENFYGPLCSRCHHLAYEELAHEKWTKLDLSKTRDFTSLDLF